MQNQPASRQMGQHVWADVYPILKAFLFSIFFSGQNILLGKLKLQIQTCQVVQTTSWDNRVVFLSLCTFYEKKGTYHRGCCKHCVRTKLGLWCTGLPLGGWHAIKKNGIQAMQLSSQRLLTNFHPVFFLMCFNDQARFHCLIFKQTFLCWDNKALLRLLIFSSMADCHSWWSK